MRETTFWHYDATGNTFVIADRRDKNSIDLNEIDISKLCAYFRVDGALFLESPQNSSHLYHMRYLNSDGVEVEMCGNGARALIHFAWKKLGLVKADQGFLFSTLASVYEGRAIEGYPVRMTELYDIDAIDISDFFINSKSAYLNTGVPHCLFECDDVSAIELIKEGRRIRYDERFEKGTNVNFYQIIGSSQAKMRTYERGVENETLSCGTGACALAVTLKRQGHESPFIIEIPGGRLNIDVNNDFSEIYLKGDVKTEKSEELSLDSFRKNND